MSGHYWDNLGYWWALVLRGESLEICWSDVKSPWMGWDTEITVTGGPGDCTA